MSNLFYTFGKLILLCGVLGSCAYSCSITSPIYINGGSISVSSHYVTLAGGLFVGPEATEGLEIGPNMLVNLRSSMDLAGKNSTCKGYVRGANSVSGPVSAPFGNLVVAGYDSLTNVAFRLNQGLANSGNYYSLRSLNGINMYLQRVWWISSFPSFCAKTSAATDGDAAIACGNLVMFLQMCQDDLNSAAFQAATGTTPYTNSADFSSALGSAATALRGVSGLSGYDALFDVTTNLLTSLYGTHAANASGTALYNWLGGDPTGSVGSTFTSQMKALCSSSATSGNKPTVTLSLDENLGSDVAAALVDSSSTVNLDCTQMKVLFDNLPTSDVDDSQLLNKSSTVQSAVGLTVSVPAPTSATQTYGAKIVNGTNGGAALALTLQGYASSASVINLTCDGSGYTNGQINLTGNGNNSCVYNLNPTDDSKHFSSPINIGANTIVNFQKGGCLPAITFGGKDAFL